VLLKSRGVALADVLAVLARRAEKETR
jgi:phosphoribosyl-ATP pyrophosphohydrolase